jgi:hypothetical protein
VVTAVEAIEKVVVKKQDLRNNIIEIVSKWREALML